MEPKGLSNLFMKFGVVKDVFIPHKRRQVTQSRFGFVRFSCEVVAKVALQKANGLWVDGKVLLVKNTDFGRERKVDGLMQSQPRNQIVQRSHQAKDKKAENQFMGQRTFVDTVKRSNTRNERNSGKKGCGRERILSFKSNEELKSKVKAVRKWLGIDVRI
ncbi:serine/arginine-rich splicing factor SC35-like [Camellia sinensis]|uniref:serine/arginine-rich splicing factor SC35-like n=1 Tax=Camellia sinensis TaxID=4442 RepID=UPI001036B594|nr:serine/arginine-rich splicing factor SC35-like [Camellia sinensis]